MQRTDRMKFLAQTIQECSERDNFLTTAQLLEWHGSLYGASATPKARKKSIERDLSELVKAGLIERISGKLPYQYRSLNAEDVFATAYALELMQAVIQDALPHRSFEHLWPALLKKEKVGLPLGKDKLRILPDTLRLIPADISPDVLTQVLHGLVEKRPLSITYQDAQGKRSEPLIHPHGLVQRGPRLYLFAIKDEDRENMRMYVLHRMVTAVCTEMSFYQKPGFSLQACIERGQADFASGERIQLELRVRGYVTDLLEGSPLAENQVVTVESDGSAFDAHVSATLPSTGQLLRWLLGCGDNVEVLAPLQLRRTVAQQAAKMAGIYGPQALAA